MSDQSRNDVAILIPVYLNQEGLEHSLASLRNDPPSFHVIVVDDGSVPPARIDAEQYPFPITLLRLERNSGIVAALNCGLAFIRERNFAFVARLDTGDSWHIGRLKAQTEFLLANPDHALIGTWVHYVDRTGRPIFNWIAPCSDLELRKHMFLRDCFVHPAVMMRLSALCDIGYYDPAFLHVEDYELFFRILRKYKAANLPEYLCTYECDASAPGISVRHRKKQLLGRLKVLAANASPLSPWFYAGIIIVLTMLVIPREVVASIKRLVWGAGALK